MKKILALLIMVLTLGCTTALAAAYVPPTTADVPNVPEALTYPEYTITYEDGYCVVKTDWMKELHSIVGNGIGVENENGYVFGNYNEARQAFVSSQPLEEAPLSRLIFSFSNEKWGDERVQHYVDINFDSDSGEVIYYSLETTIWIDDIQYNYFWDAEGRLVEWDNWEYDLCVQYDEYGNALGYLYKPANSGTSTFNEYLMDGTIAAAHFKVGEKTYHYHSWMVGVDDETGESVYNHSWENDYYEECDPPAGYTISKLYELFPPLTGNAAYVPAPGDTNDNGRLTVDDALNLIKNLADNSVSIVESAADLNNDGKVDGKDVLNLLQHFAGWRNKLK